MNPALPVVLEEGFEDECVRLLEDAEVDEDQPGRIVSLGIGRRRGGCRHPQGQGDEREERGRSRTHAPRTAAATRSSLTGSCALACRSLVALTKHQTVGRGVDAGSLDAKRAGFEGIVDDRSRHELGYPLLPLLDQGDHRRESIVEMGIGRGSLGLPTQLTRERARDIVQPVLLERVSRMRKTRQELRGPGPFVTRIVHLLEDGRRLVATTRRQRKGLAPRVLAPDQPDSGYSTPRSAWAQWWAPRRLAWWIALLFAVGSTLFALGGAAASWPGALPIPPARLNPTFFVGSIFFTSAAWLQLMEAANADVAGASERWRWFGWRPRDLGWVASAVQLMGTIFFNFNTGDAMISGLGWAEADLLVWTPGMVGCVCFLVASWLAWVEYSQGAASFAPRSVSWWIVVVNVLGSIAFQVSALAAFVGPGPSDSGVLWLSSVSTFVGALCFLVGALLLVPEMFDGEMRE